METIARFKEKLLTVLEENVVFIMHTDKDVNGKKPYTLRKDLCTIEDQKQIKNDSPWRKAPVYNPVIVVHDLLANKDIKLNVSHILHYNVHFRKDPELNLTHYKNWNTKYKEHIKPVEEGDYDIDDDALHRLYASTTPELFKLVYMFNFKFKSKDIESDNLSPDQLEEAREMWMDVIRSARVNAFEELDELAESAKANSEEVGDDDLADIEIIKQMFRDIPQDTDLTVYTTLKDLVQFWPSLLLPIPDEVNIPKEVFEVTWPSSQLSPEDHDLIKLLKRIDDVDELKAVHDEISEEGFVAPVYAKKWLSERIEELA